LDLSEKEMIQDYTVKWAAMIEAEQIAALNWPQPSFAPSRFETRMAVGATGP
jgi:hypothetical protein